ncbi:MAG: DEAD/DEAH box helicase [Desulfovibrionales bacterium]|nr:DEAD/DEAH box helicase [Desulfovibrionales bacterium]
MRDQKSNGHPALDASTHSKTNNEFSLHDLPQALQEAIARMHWAELMPVQRQTLPPMLDGQDVMVQSQTGSGKTGAFLLPMMHRIDASLGVPQALILVPTRELAVQVCREAEGLVQGTGLRVLSIYGGVGYKGQIDGLAQGAQLIVGTPGRILDHLLKGTLNLDQLRMLVFDEADRMLSMGFYPDMKQLQRYLPRGLQSAMFSATYPGHVQRLAQQFLQDPILLSLSQDHVHATDVLHVVYKVPAMQKSRILVKVIEQENPASGIIFCNTKADVHFVSTVLQRFGYDVGELSADLTQAAREAVLEKLRHNKLKFLVATDVAARGIDIHELSHVFQYQPPQDHEAYIHRTGRTGRAGAAGVAISFVSGMEEIELDQIAKKFSITMHERSLPADEELEVLISQRAVALLEAKLRDADNICKERMGRFMRTVADLATNEDSCTLLAMLIDDFYQKTFHAPLEQPSEKLVRAVRPEPATQSRGGNAVSTGESQEKKRRKRGRKKTASETVPADTAVTAEQVSLSRPEEISGPRGQSILEHAIPAHDPEPAPLPAATQPQGQEAADFDFGLDSIWDQPESAAENGNAAKKRRRRRPRKPAGSKNGTNGIQASAERSVVPALQEEARQPGESGQEPKKGQTKNNASNGAVNGAPGGASNGAPSGATEKQQNPQRKERSDTHAHGQTREPQRSGKQATQHVPTKAPAKPKKKIFLE